MYTLLAALLLVKSAYYVATIYIDDILINERFFYPFCVLPELLILAILALPRMMSRLEGDETFYED